MSTSGASRAAARANSSAGAEPDLGANGALKVPQWIGTAARGRRRRNAPAWSMFGVRRAYTDAAEVHLVPGRNLEHMDEPAPSNQPARTCRDDNCYRAVEPVERPQIQVVEVRVRDEDSVELADSRGADSL